MKELPLFCGRVAIVSDIDYDRCMEHRWRADVHNASGKPYVKATVGRTSIYLHRLITGCQPPYKVDHKNRDTLDNQRPNLRIATHDLNNANRCGFGLSGFKGVTASGGSWRARLRFDGVVYQLGSFARREDAARAYDAAAFERFGEFAFLNFPEEWPHYTEAAELPF